jgi:outer membrane lipoprotein carrier protein
MLRPTVAFTLVLATSLPLAAQTRPPAEVVARNFQQRYQSIRDFSADFVHTYRGGVLRTQATERGTVSIRKPGRLRFLYTSPERKEFVSDGSKIYSYLVDQKQVIVNDVPPEGSTTAAMFLAGRGDIVRDFTVSYPETAPAGTLALKLTPKRAEPDYEYLIVAVDPDTLQLRSVTTHDRQGADSTLTFSNMKENRGLSDKDFAFRIPRGVDVITDGARN